MTTHDHDDLLFERIGRVALITLNRPHRKNALTAGMLDGLAALVTDLAYDRSVGCVVLTGAGGAFCSGADVQNMAARGGAPAQLTTQERTAQVARRCGAAMRLHDMAKPTISVIDGVAAGGGMGLALACDIRIASPSARFVTAFARVALPGDYGAPFFLARRCPGAAEELMFLSEPVPAQRALALGLVNRIMPRETLMDDALRMAQGLADGPTETFAAMKRNLRLAATGDMRAAFALEASSTVHALQRPEHLEAAKAFASRTTTKETA